MKLKAKKALLEATVRVLSSLMIVIALLTQAREVSIGTCFVLCGGMMLGQAWCIWKGGWWN